MSTPGELLEALGREARARFAGGGEGSTRVYRGRSVEELVPQIQRELGADAIIVRRREGLTGGVFGFFQHAYVEIEAMPGAPGVDLYDEELEQMPPAPEPVSPPAPSVSEQPPAPFAAPPPPAAPPPFAAPPPPAAPPQPFAPPPPVPVAPAPPPAPVAPPIYQRPVAPPPQYQQPPAPAFEQPSVDPPPYQRPALSPRQLPPAPVPRYQPPPAPAPAADTGTGTGTGSVYVTAHLAALARAGRAVASPPPEPTSALPPLPRAAPRRAPAPAPAWPTEFQQPSPSSPPPAFPTAAQRPPAPSPRPSERRVVAPGSHARARAGVARSLERCGIGPELAQELIDGASAHALALAPRAGLAQAVRVTLAQRIPVAPPLPTKGAAIVMVGAGGTGKTTCCAALLAAYRRSSSLPASCATITRKPGRADRVAGAAGGEPSELQIILSPTILKPSPARSPRALRALRRALSEGLVVIDTPSLSPADRTGVRELARLLSELEPERVVVTLPATLGATAAAQLLQALRPLAANSLAVTHADETDQLGVAVEAACRFGLAPEYLLERASAGGWRLRHTDPTALAEKLLP